VNLEMLMDLRQRRKTWSRDNGGGGGSGEIVKVEKIGK